MRESEGQGGTVRGSESELQRVREHEGARGRVRESERE